MINTTKFIKLIAVLCLAFIILEISTTESKPLNDDDRVLRSAVESFGRRPTNPTRKQTHGDDIGDYPDNPDTSSNSHEVDIDADTTSYVDNYREPTNDTNNGVDDINTPSSVDPEKETNSNSHNSDMPSFVEDEELPLMGKKNKADGNGSPSSVDVGQATSKEMNNTVHSNNDTPSYRYGDVEHGPSREMQNTVHSNDRPSNGDVKLKPYREMKNTVQSNDSPSNGDVEHELPKEMKNTVQSNDSPSNGDVEHELPKEMKNTVQSNDSPSNGDVEDELPKEMKNTVQSNDSSSNGDVKHEPSREMKNTVHSNDRPSNGDTVEEKNNTVHSNDAPSNGDVQEKNNSVHSNDSGRSYGDVYQEPSREMNSITDSPSYGRGDDKEPTKDTNNGIHSNNRESQLTNRTDSSTNKSSEKPMIIPSYDPVDNTDLSLEKPDSVMNDENTVLKDAEHKTSLSHSAFTEEPTHPNRTNNSSALNEFDYSQQDDISGFSGISNQDRNESNKEIELEEPSKAKGLQEPLENEMELQEENQDKDLEKPKKEKNPLEDHSAGALENVIINSTNGSTTTNKTSPTTKKLIHFLDISENYTRTTANKSHGTAKNESVVDLAITASTHRNASFNLKNIANSSLPILPKKKVESLPSINKYKHPRPPLHKNVVKSYSFANQQPMYKFNTSYPSRPYSPAFKQNSLNVMRPPQIIQSPISYQTTNRLSPYQVQAIKPTSSPYYTPYWYQKSPWPYKIAYQVPAVRKLPYYQNYQQRQYLSKARPPLYNLNTGLYQRSNVPRPGIKNTEGPFQQFEDAVIQSKIKQYQSFPYYNNNMNLIPKNKVSSSSSSPAFLRSGVGRLPFGQNNLTPQKPPNVTRKQAYNVYQAAIYFADLLKNESLRIDGTSSGDNSIPEEMKDEEFNGEDDNGSGDVIMKEKSKPSFESNGITEKQVDKLIQAQDLGAREIELEGSTENAIPEFKETKDGSGEVLSVESKKDSKKGQEFAGTMESSKTVFSQGEQPTIVTGGEATASQPGAQVFTDATGAAQPGAQTYNYATATSANQPEGQSYNDAQPAQQTDTSAQTAAAQPAAQTYNDAAAQTTQPAAPYYNDASAQTAAQPASQYYNDAASEQAPAAPAAQYYSDASSQTAPAAQPAVQSYAEAPSQPEPKKPQADALKIPASIDVALEATHPGEQLPNYASNNPATHPSELFSDANGVPKPVDAATMVTNPQTEYYNNQAQQASQQTVANTQPSTLTTDEWQQWNAATAAAQQPMQYTSQTSVPQQDALSTNQNDQAYLASLSPNEKLRKMDESDENKFRTVVCQNNQDVIACPQGKKINIIDAHYGSMGMSSCQGLQASFLPMEPCEIPGADQKVKTSCDDMENCVLSANDGLFGDSCQSDRKYLDVTYKCDANKERGHCYYRDRDKHSLIDN